MHAKKLQVRAKTHREQSPCFPASDLPVHCSILTVPTKKRKLEVLGTYADLMHLCLQPIAPAGQLCVQGRAWLRLGHAGSDQNTEWPLPLASPSHRKLPWDGPYQA